MIVSSRGGLPELVNAPECGIVAGLSPGSLADALVRLSDPVIRERLAKNAFIRYQMNHQPGIYVESYLRLCEEMEIDAA